MINFEEQNKVNEEVYHTTQKLLILDNNDITNLKNIANQNIRKRSRICSHMSSNDIVQEMIIVHPKGAYVRPHKHINKVESMMILEGEIDFILFDDNGKIETRVPMGNYSSGLVFYDSMKESKYHTLIIKSEWLVFLEITKGPFQKSDTIFAPWSPEDSDQMKVEQFMKSLIKEI